MLSLGRARYSFLTKLNGLFYPPVIESIHQIDIYHHETGWMGFERHFKRRSSLFGISGPEEPQKKFRTNFEFYTISFMLNNLTWFKWGNLIIWIWNEHDGS